MKGKQLKHKRKNGPTLMCTLSFSLATNRDSLTDGTEVSPTTVSRSRCAVACAWLQSVSEIPPSSSFVLAVNVEFDETKQNVSLRLHRDLLASQSRVTWNVLVVTLACSLPFCPDDHKSETLDFKIAGPPFIVASTSAATLWSAMLDPPARCELYKELLHYVHRT